MGLLDEAIKEHLDLKRRRGADPGEIERLEREALGPVRRLQQEPAVEDTLPDETDADYEEVDYADEPYDEHELEPDYELEDDEPELGGGLAASAPEATPRADPDHDRLGTHGVVPPHRDDELIEPAEPGPLSPEDHLGVETAEYDVEAEHAREAEPARDHEPPREAEGAREGEEDDVLEETPEFFQDAPDHDRLWFEQRPPKDFDFEG